MSEELVREQNGGMKQQPKTRRSAAQAQALAALACPACELCAKPTRFVGLESISDNQHADLCTYECNECGHMQANVVTRDGDRNGAWRPHALDA